MSKIKIRETYYEMDDTKINILHEIAIIFQSEYWAKEQLADIFRRQREGKK